MCCPAQSNTVCWQPSSSSSLCLKGGGGRVWSSRLCSSGLVLAFVCKCAVDWRCRLSVYPSSVAFTFSRKLLSCCSCCYFCYFNPDVFRAPEFAERVGNTAVCHTCNQFFALLLLRFLRHIYATEKFHIEEKVFPLLFPPEFYPTVPHFARRKIPPLARAGVSLEMEGFSSGTGVFPLMQRTDFLLLLLIPQRKKLSITACSLCLQLAKLLPCVILFFAAPRVPLDDGEIRTTHNLELFRKLFSLFFLFFTQSNSVRRALGSGGRDPVGRSYSRRGHFSHTRIAHGFYPGATIFTSLLFATLRDCCCERRKFFTIQESVPSPALARTHP